jgi:hypothetical protein
MYNKRAYHGSGFPVLLQGFHGYSHNFIFCASCALSVNPLAVVSSGIAEGAQLVYGSFATFRWKHAKKHIAYANRAALDLGDDRIFILQKMYPEPPVGGRGVIWSKAKFIQWLLSKSQ